MYENFNRTRDITREISAKVRYAQHSRELVTCTSVRSCHGRDLPHYERRTGAAFPALTDAACQAQEILRPARPNFRPRQHWNQPCPLRTARGTFVTSLPATAANAPDSAITQNRKTISPSVNCEQATGKSAGRREQYGGTLTYRNRTKERKNSSYRRFRVSPHLKRKLYFNNIYYNTY